MGFCQWPEMGSKVVKVFGCKSGFENGSNPTFEPTLDPFRDIDKNPLLTHFQGGWKLFSKRGPGAALTQRNKRGIHFFKTPSIEKKLFPVPEFHPPKKLHNELLQAWEPTRWPNIVGNRPAPCRGLSGLPGPKYVCNTPQKTSTKVFLESRYYHYKHRTI